MAGPRIFERLSGRELAALRRKAGLTQLELAQAAGVGRHAVVYWERSATVTPWSWAPQRLLAALEIAVVPPVVSSSGALSRAGAPAHGHGVSPHPDPNAAQARDANGTAITTKIVPDAQATRRRVPCDAKTRKGHPCRLLSEPGRRRCKHHGGRSTGPRTPEGRARIAEAQRRRWAAWRKAKRP